MATAKQATTRRLNMRERAEEQKKILFPTVPNELLWHRKGNDGWSTVPRTLPIAMQAIDAQSKGAPAGHTLFCLWARCPDHPLLIIESPAVIAHEAGFSGERAIDTWRKRMKQLVELKFIRCLEGPSGEYHHVLLMNPNVAVEKLYEAEKIQTTLYARFKYRLNEIGAHRDLVDFEAYREGVTAKKAAKTKKAATAVTEPEAVPPVAVKRSAPRRRLNQAD